MALERDQRLLPLAPPFSCPLALGPSVRWLATAPITRLPVQLEARTIVPTHPIRAARNLYRVPLLAAALAVSALYGFSVVNLDDRQSATSSGTCVPDTPHGPSTFLSLAADLPTLFESVTHPRPPHVGWGSWLPLHNDLRIRSRVNSPSLTVEARDITRVPEGQQRSPRIGT